MDFNCEYLKTHKCLCHFQWFSIINVRKHTGLFLNIFIGFHRLVVAFSNGFKCEHQKPRFSVILIIFYCKYQTPIGFLLFSMIFDCKYQRSRLRARQNNACSTTKCMIKAWERVFLTRSWIMTNLSQKSKADWCLETDHKA